jgi:hypothetical protein
MLYSLPEKVTLLDLRNNQILRRHEKFPTIFSPRLRLRLEGNPGYIDLNEDFQSDSFSDAAVSSRFGDVPPILLSPLQAGFMELDDAGKSPDGLELLRLLYEEEGEDEEDEEDSDYVSSEDTEDLVDSSHDEASGSSSSSPSECNPNPM